MIKNVKCNCVLGCTSKCKKYFQWRLNKLDTILRGTFLVLLSISFVSPAYATKEDKAAIVIQKAYRQHKRNQAERKYFANIKASIVGGKQPLENVFAIKSYSTERIRQNIHSMILQNGIATIEDALKFVQSEKVRNYLRPNEIAQAIISLNRLLYPSLSFLPLDSEGYEEVFIQALNLRQEEVMRRHEQALDSVLVGNSEKSERTELSDRIQENAVSCKQCFPIETLPSSLQPKALAVLNSLFLEEGLYTLVGGLKPASWLYLNPKNFNLQEDEFYQVLGTLHCGSLVVLDSSRQGAFGHHLWLARLDRVEDVKVQYSDWFDQAKLSKGGGFKDLIESTQFIPMIRIEPPFIERVLDIHLAQTALDVAFNEDPKRGKEFLQRNLSVLRHHLPDLTDQADLMMIFEKSNALDSSGHHFDRLLLDLFRSDSKMAQEFVRKVNPILRERSLEIKAGASLDDILERIERYNQIANKENEEIEKRNEEIRRLPLLVSLQESPDYVREMIQKIVPNLQSEFPEVSFETGLETILEKVEIYNKRIEEKNSVIQSYSDKFIGALLGYPRHAVEFFVSHPGAKRISLDFPTLRGRAHFVYVVPEGHMQNQEDLKIAKAAYTIFSHFIRSGYIYQAEGNSTQAHIQDNLNYFRSFYKLDNGQCSAARRDDLRLSFE